MEEYKDCLACKDSFSMDDDNGEPVLWCVEKKEVVKEDDTCDKFCD